MLTRRESEALDRHITGNYGEDQFAQFERGQETSEEDYIPRHKQKGRGRTPSTCYRKGSNARKFGASKSANPYDRATYEFYEWRAGWLGMQVWIADHPDELWPEAKE